MNLALECYADNPIIDELVVWPPRRCRIKRVRGCNVLFRKPFIEVELEDGEIFQRHFPRQSFARYWAEACVILQTITAIETVAEFGFEPVADRAALEAEVLARRRECIDEVDPMYDEGMYAQFLMQFGADCKDLPPETEQRLVEARRRQAAAS